MEDFSFWILNAHSLLHFTRKLCISVRPWVYYWDWGRTFFWNAPKGLVEKRIPRWIIPPTPLKKSPYLFYMSPPFFGSFPDQQNQNFSPEKHFISIIIIIPWCRDVNMVFYYELIIGKNCAIHCIAPLFYGKVHAQRSDGNYIQKIE